MNPLQKGLLRGPICSPEGLGSISWWQSGLHGVGKVGPLWGRNYLLVQAWSLCQGTSSALQGCGHYPCRLRDDMPDKEAPRATRGRQPAGARSEGEAHRPREAKRMKPQFQALYKQRVPSHPKVTQGHLPSLNSYRFSLSWVSSLTGSKKQVHHLPQTKIPQNGTPPLNWAPKTQASVKDLMRSRTPQRQPCPFSHQMPQT